MLDPVNCSKNAGGRYHVPLAKLDDDAREEVDAVVGAFEDINGDTGRELTQLEMSSFPERYSKSLDHLCKRTTITKGGRTVVTVQPRSERVDFYNNALGEKTPVVTRAVNTLLCMPVTACAAERKLSKWGATYVPNRNRLGLEQAQKLIFVQQNDSVTRDEREEDVFVE